MGSIDSQILNNRARAEEAKNLSKEYANKVSDNGVITDPEYPNEDLRSAKWWSLYAPDLVSEFFVNENGKDDDPSNYPGKSNSGAFATIARACEAVADAKVELYMTMMDVTEEEAREATSDGYQMYIPITFNINVAAGTYNEVSSIRVPAFTSITGESLRASIINWDEERPEGIQYSKISKATYTLDGDPFPEDLNFALSVTLRDDVNSKNLTVGVDPEGDVNFVEGLDSLAPPLPPEGAFDARIKVNEVSYFTKYQDNDNSTKEFEFEYTPSTGNGDIRVTFSSKILDTVANIVIKDKFGGNVYSENLSNIGTSFTPIELNSVLKEGFIMELTPTGNENPLQVGNDVIFEPAGIVFQNTIDVTLKNATNSNAPIRYTTDGSIPDINSEEYTGPITITETTTIRAVSFLESEEAIKNLFLLNNGCYVYNLRLSNGPGVDNMYDPKNGFYFAFDNGAFISTSPYIQNCTTSYVPSDKFYSILDPGSSTAAEPNPLVGNGPGGMIVDDRNLDGYSPLKSMIVDAYTQVAFNGIGLCVRGRGYAQMVSFFTNFSRVGVYAIDGGHASLLNSNTTFGDYGLRARGKRFTVNARVDQIPDADANPSLSQEILDSKPAVLQYMFEQLALEYPSSGYDDPDSYTYKATEKDASLLIEAIANDFLNSSADRTAQFVQGQFKGIDTSEGNVYTTASGAVAVYDLDLVDQFLDSFDFIQEGIRNNTSIVSNNFNKLRALIAMVKEVHRKVVKDDLSIDHPLMGQDPDDPENTGIVRPFGSLITSTAHDFSYAGSGVNFLGLPSNQNGVGATDFDIRVFKDLNDQGESEGRVYHTSGDEFGDFFAGDDFVIRQETGTIEGRTFSKALFALVTPFSLALES